MRDRAWLVLALLPLLSGCLAAVALPLAAGGSLMAATSHRVRAATPVRTGAPRAAKAKKGSNKNASAATAPAVVPTGLKELPPPGVSSAAGPGAEDPWQTFFAYALEQAAANGGEEDKAQSALLAGPPSLEIPIRRACPSPHPAVVIDLDGEQGVFDPGHPTAVPPGVGEGLARLRAAQVVVLWISRLPAARAAEVAAALRTAGLDPQGQDQLLLIRGNDDRKQLLREDANRDVCVVAVAGDRRADFDELFDYLRNPDAAIGLDTMLGKGWFLVPALDAMAAAPR